MLAYCFFKSRIFCKDTPFLFMFFIIWLPDRLRGNLSFEKASWMFSSLMGFTQKKLKSRERASCFFGADSALATEWSSFCSPPWKTLAVPVIMTTFLFIFLFQPSIKQILWQSHSSFAVIAQAIRTHTSYIRWLLDEFSEPNSNKVLLCGVLP